MVSWTNCRACGLPILECRCGGLGDEPRADPIPQPQFQEKIKLEIDERLVEACLRQRYERQFSNHRVSKVTRLADGSYELVLEWKG